MPYRPLTLLPIAPLPQPPALPARWQCDLADDGLAWTPGVFDLFGLERGRRLDRREVIALYTPESRERLERLRTHAIRTGGSFTIEAEIVRPDGTPRRFLLTADTLMRGGRVTHLYGTKTDITDAA